MLLEENKNKTTITPPPHAHLIIEIERIRAEIVDRVTSESRPRSHTHVDGA